MPLTDEDLKLLGVIGSYWALAEHSLEHDLELIMGDSKHQAEIAPFAAQKLVSFSKKVDAFKKLLRITCQEYPDTLEIGRALMMAGTLISQKRKKLTHWIALRAGPEPDMIRLVDSGRHGVQIEHLPALDLTDIAGEIADWWIDLNKFMVRLIIDGPLASQTTVHGPRPDVASLSWKNFRTIQKIPQTPTN